MIEGPISFYALCEHHALPFHGFAHVGYVAHEQIIGISKLTRLVRLFARRFTVQERFGEQIADTLVELMEPHGVAVHLEAEHLCTQMRGVREEHSKTVTSSGAVATARTRSCGASSSQRSATGIPGAKAKEATHATRTRYLIVGGGLTADAACRGIREHDPDGTIGLVGDEPHPPYARPPLSKALWKGDDEDTIWRGTAELGVDLRLGRRSSRSTCRRREATDDAGETYGYERLLLATGGRPRRLPFGGDEVIYFRTLDDYRRLRALADGRARFVVIGGGFIGSEIAAALAMNGCTVTMVFPEPGSARASSPPTCPRSSPTTTATRASRCSPATSVTGIERAGGVTQVSTEDGRTLEADVVVAGLGIEPRTELAAAAGLPVADGIVVDEHGRVGGREDVFAAGDVARFPAAALGDDMRVEHEDHAKSHGRRSARTWPAPASPTTTCRSSTPTCSTSATRRSASSTRARRRSPSGRSRTARASSTTSTASGARAAFCSGTSSAASTLRAT